MTRHGGLSEKPPRLYSVTNSVGHLLPAALFFSRGRASALSPSTQACRGVAPLTQLVGGTGAAKARLGFLLGAIVEHQLRLGLALRRGGTQVLAWEFDCLQSRLQAAERRKSVIPTVESSTGTKGANLDILIIASRTTAASPHGPQRARWNT